MNQVVENGLKNQEAKVIAQNMIGEKIWEILKLEMEVDLKEQDTSN